MTCIVGIRTKDQVLIGGDSAGTDDALGQRIRMDTKVFRVNSFIIGYTTSYRMGQILRYELKLPKVTGDIFKYMVTKFIPAVRDCLRKGGYLMKWEESQQEEISAFLVGYKNRLFLIEEDMQVGESFGDYEASGCGEDFAMGVLGSEFQHKDPFKRVEDALSVSAKFSAGVAKPFRILNTKNKKEVIIQ